MAARQLGMKPHLVLRWPGEIVSDVVARRLGIMEWCSVQEDLIIYPVVKLLLRHYGNCIDSCIVVLLTLECLALVAPHVSLSYPSDLGMTLCPYLYNVTAYHTVRESLLQTYSLLITM